MITEIEFAELEEIGVHPVILGKIRELNARTPERERLRSAVIGWAQRLRLCARAPFYTGDDISSPCELVDPSEDAPETEAALFAAIDELEAHDRKAGG